MVIGCYQNLIICLPLDEMVLVMLKDNKILNDYGYEYIPLTKSGNVDWKSLSKVDPVKIDMKNFEITLCKLKI